MTSVGRIHLFDVAGTGALPPCVILHGFSAAGAHYFPLVFRLADHVRRIVLPDFPGHGLSDTPDAIDLPSIEAGFFEALDAILDEPAVMIGNSMGGLAAIRYANHCPDRVRGLLLISPAGAPADPELERVFDVDTHQDALEFVDRLFHQPSRLRHLYALGVRRRFQRPVMRRFLDLLGPDPLDPSDLATRVIFGRSDRIFSESHRAFFRTHLPEHSEIEEPAELGHVPFLDRADELSERIVDFLVGLGGDCCPDHGSRPPEPQT
jgi:pimeloyl-ACP methyl ester carboxylesterase